MNWFEANNFPFMNWREQFSKFNKNWEKNVLILKDKVFFKFEIHLEYLKNMYGYNLIQFSSQSVLQFWNQIRIPEEYECFTT